MQQASIDIYKRVKDAHELGTIKLVDLKKLLRPETGTLELSDLAYAMRECSKLVDDLRKNFNEVQDLAEKCACMIFVRDHVNQPDVTNIQTDYVCATPDPEMIPGVPRRKHEPEKYNALMKFLNIPEEYAMAGESEYKAPVQFYWPGLVELCTERHKQGLPLPPGIDPTKSFPAFKLRMRKRKEVDADIAAMYAAEAKEASDKKSDTPF